MIVAQIKLSQDGKMVAIELQKSRHLVQSKILKAIQSIIGDIDNGIVGKVYGQQIREWVPTKLGKLVVAEVQISDIRRWLFGICWARNSHNEGIDISIIKPKVLIVDIAI